MAKAHSSFAAATPRRARSLVGGSGLGPHQATIDALNAPVAVLAASGSVVAVNSAWRAANREDSDNVHCHLGENYLEGVRTLLGEGGGGAVLYGVAGVLKGEQKSFKCNHSISDHATEHSLCVRRIAGDQPARFLVSHELRSADVGEELESRLLTAQIEERERLAAELHDSVGQNLVSLGLSLARLRQMVQPGSAVSDIVADMAELLQQAHAEIRTLSFLLQPPWLDERGAFRQTVRDFVRGFARRAGLQATVAASDVPDLCHGRQLALFRILQEALVNIHRHARADAVEVELFARERRAILKVRDNGRGMPAPEGAPPNPGVGILSMRARLQTWGGDLRIVSSQDGTTLIAKLPF